VKPKEILLPSFFKLKDKLFYGWVVIVASIIIGTILFGASSSFGVFFKSIESEFDLSRAATSGIYSIYWVFGIIFTILSGWALDRYGPRTIIFLSGLFTGLSLLLTSQTNSSWQLFITYSLLLSIGISPIYVVIMSTVSRWFDRKRGLAIGLASSGDALGMVIMAPFATFLISALNWRLAYIVIGLISLVIVIPLSRLLKKDPHEIGNFPDGVKLGSGEMGEQKLKKEEGYAVFPDYSLQKVLKTRSFWFLVLMWVFSASSFLMVLTHLVPYTTDIGYSAGEAATVLSLLSGMMIVGKVLMGKASDNIGRKKVAIICSLLQAGALAWLIWSQDLWMLYVFAVVYGFASGGLFPPATALVGDIFGLRNIGLIMGVLNIGAGIGSAIGPFIGGFVFDLKNSYSIAFLVGIVAKLIATVFLVLIRKKTSNAMYSPDS
jgi:MFS family permease